MRTKGSYDDGQFQLFLLRTGMLLFKQLVLNTKCVEALAPTQCAMLYTFKDGVNLLSHRFSLKLQD